MAVGLLALVEPVLVEAAKRVLIILGGTAAGGVVVEETQKRREEAEETKDDPISKAETKTGRCCKKCPPDEGNTFQRKVDVTKNWVQYQAKITGMVVGPDYIEEWRYKGREFDGFKSELCLLQEAKADYDQFFKSKGVFKYLFQREIFSEMLEAATKQVGVVRTSAPASLTYYFQTPLAYDYMKDKLTMLGIMVVLAP